MNAKECEKSEIDEKKDDGLFNGQFTNFYFFI